MRQNSFLPIAIFALNAGEVEHELGILRANGFNANKPLEGKYTHENGEVVTENSYLVALGEGQREEVIRLAREYGQESVLFSGIDRTCTLYFIEDGREEIIGVLREAKQAEAVLRDAYTFDPSSGKYFIVE